MQSQTRPSSRVLKPSQQQQQTRTSSQAGSSDPSPTKPKPKPTFSTPSSVLTRDRLQANLHYYQFLTRVQHLLIETAAVSPATLHRASLVLRPVDYEEVTQERSNDGRCGWPTCGNDTQQQSKAKGRYRLSLRQHKVWEVEGPRLYCSEQCEEASAEYAVSLKEDPLYMRRVGELMAAVQHGGQQQQDEESQRQQTAQQLLASLPAQHDTPYSATHTALTNALPANAETSGLIIKENSAESVQLVVGGQAAAIEGYRPDQPLPSSQPYHPSSPSLTPSREAVSKRVSASAVHRKATNVQFASHVRTADSVSIQPAAVDEHEEELLDEIARTAVSEKAKLSRRINPITGVSRTPTLHSPPLDDDDTQSADEAKHNFAAIRHANPLSPFAQLAGLLTHYVTDDTIALLRGSGSMDVTPASSGLARRRQEALLGWLHGELRMVCDGLAIRCSKPVEDAVDVVALTFLLNESVPALPSRLWQVLVAVILLALHRRIGGGGVFEWDVRAASTFVSERGFTAVQLSAFMDIILPPTTGNSELSIATATLQPETANTAPAGAAQHTSTSAVSPPDTSLLSVPRYILSSALSFLDSPDLSPASVVCSLFRLLSHPLKQHSDERTLLEHDNSLAATRMHTMGYREGVQEGREALMQSGFDVGMLEGWTRGRAEECKKGLLGALSMWNEKQPVAGQVAAAGVGWSTADVDWLWQQCERINGAVMRRPKERGGRGAIGGAAAADEQKQAAEHGGVAWDERCVRLLRQLGVDGAQLVNSLAGDIGVEESAELSSEHTAGAEERELDARIAAELSDANDSRERESAGERLQPSHVEEGGVDFRSGLCDRQQYTSPTV